MSGATTTVTLAGSGTYDDPLTLAITGVLEQYDEELEAALAKDILDAAEVARQQLRRDSPRTHGGRGHYWSGWRVDSKQLDSYGVNGTRAVVYNYNKPTLTHLLERGHDIVRGGRGRRGVVVGHAEGIPHIGRAREAALRHLTQRGW
jgi:hypothetical protein